MFEFSRIQKLNIRLNCWINVYTRVSSNVRLRSNYSWILRRSFPSSTESSRNGYASFIEFSVRICTLLEPTKYLSSIRVVITLELIDRSISETPSEREVTTTTSFDHVNVIYASRLIKNKSETRGDKNASGLNLLHRRFVDYLTGNRRTTRIR